jgi:hypothetical protein
MKIALASLLVIVSATMASAQYLGHTFGGSGLSGTRVQPEQSLRFTAYHLKWDLRAGALRD